MARTARYDSTDQRDPAESIPPRLRTDPIERTDSADPTLPTDMNEPTLPIESIEPFDAMERIDPSDRHDHFELPTCAGCRTDVPPGHEQ